ncbi:MAG: STAS domain-containing protein [Terriglobales bacterium]
MPAMSNTGAQSAPPVIRVWDKDEVRIISVEGPLTISHLFPFQDAWRAEAAAPRLVLDLSGVPYADSSAIGSFVNAHVSRQNRGGTMAVVVVERVKKVLEITKVTGIFPVCATLEEAISATQKR